MRNTKKPLFQQRHYEALAKWIHDTVDDKHLMYYELMPFFREDNPNFKPDRFRKACGVDD